MDVCVILAGLFVVILNEALFNLYVVFSVRVPDDSDSQSGVIRQRQNCLELRTVEGQEFPVLTLAPCIGKEGVPAINQVGWFFEAVVELSQFIGACIENIIFS